MENYQTFSQEFNYWMEGSEKSEVERDLEAMWLLDLEFVKKGNCYFSAIITWQEDAASFHFYYFNTS